MERRDLLKTAGATAGVGLTVSLSGCSLLQDGEGSDGGDGGSGSGEVPSDPVRIALIDFYSGGSEIFGHHSRQSAELVQEDINSNGGILGERELQFEFIDEATGTDQVISDIREMAQNDEIDLLMGVTSDGNANAIAPVADELGLLFIGAAASSKLYDENFTQGKMQNVFRPEPMNLIDAVGAARYIKDELPNVETVAGLNQDYAWGHLTMEQFEMSLERLVPNVEVVDSRFTEIGAGDYASQITALNQADPDLIFSTFWGSDLVNFTNQGQSQGLFEDREIVYTMADHALQDMGDSMPEGVIAGARGPNHFTWLMQENPASEEYVTAYNDEYGEYPTYPAFDKWRNIHLYISVVETAYELTGEWPDNDALRTVLSDSMLQVLPGLALPIPGQQAHFPVVYARTTYTDEYDFPILQDDLRWYAPSRVNPIHGMTTSDWIGRIQF